jgi:ATP-binding cassette subfamily B protein
VAESLGYKKVTNEQAKISKFTWDFDSLIEACQSILSIIVEFLLFYFVIKYWEQGLVTVGIFVLFQSYLFILIDQLWGFNRIIRDFYQAYADAKEMVEIRLLPHEITDTPIAKEITVGDGRIEFKNLVFTFNQTRKVLDDINLEINREKK